MIGVVIEVYEKSNKKSLTSLYSFVSKNKWFTGKLWVLTNSKDHISPQTFLSIQKIYYNSEVINITLDSDFIECLGKNSNDPGYAKLKSILIDSPRILYFSNTSLFLSNIEYLIRPRVSFMAPDASIFYLDLPNYDTSDIKELFKTDTPNNILGKIPKIDLISDNILIQASSIPDDLYTRSAEKLAASNIISFDVFTSKFTKSTRITSIWLHCTREVTGILASPISMTVKNKPVYSSPSKDGAHNITINLEDMHNLPVYKDLGSFEILASRECLKSQDKATIHIAIPTYNRKSYLHFLLRNIAEYSHQYNLLIFIYDDCSSDKYLDTIRLLNSLNVSYTLKQSTVNNGKERYANVYNNIFMDIKQSTADYFIQSADDLMLVNNFFEKAITQLSQSRQDVLNLLLTYHHVNMFKKISRPIIKVGELSVYRSSVDGAYIAKKQFFTDINYQIPLVSPQRWIKNKLKGSGTSANILAKYGKPLYQVADDSLFIHLGHDSMLNPILRKTEILESVILNPADLERYNSALIELKQDAAYSIFNNKRVIFVGPSPDILLNDNSFGKFIDSYDIIVRTNGSYPIENNNSFLGNRCDVLILNNAFTNSPSFKIGNYTNGDIKLIFEFGAVSSKSNNGLPPTQKFNKSTYSSINDTLNISRDIDTKPFSGMLAISEILNNSPKELFVCGVSNYSDLTGTHLPDYLPSTIKEEDVYSRQIKHHPNTANYQYTYFKELLKSGLISMDQHSKKYFE